MMLTISKTFKKVASVTLAATLLVTGVVVPKKLQKVDAASQIDTSKVSVNDGNASLDSFTAYDITGEITSDRSLVSVTCAVYKSLGKEAIQYGEWPYSNSEKKAQANGVKKLNLKDTKINSKLISFKYLDAGKYVLKVTATNKKGVVSEKQIPFGIKYDDKSYVLGVYSRAFAGEKISDADMAGYTRDIYVFGAREMVKEILTSDEFNAENRTNADFVDGAYYAAFGKLASENLFNLYISYLNNGSSRADVADRIVNTPGFTDVCARYNVRPNR